MNSNVVWVMVCTVGLTELAKVFITKLTGKFAALATVLIGIGVSCLYLFLPVYWDTIKVILLAVSGATVFYDTVFKLFKQLIERFSKDGNSIKEKVSSSSDNDEACR